MPPWSQDAWEAHGAKPRSFKSWKSKIHGLLLTDAVDQLEACCLLDTSLTLPRHFPDLGMVSTF